MHNARSVLLWQVFYLREDNLVWIVKRSLLWKLPIKLLHSLPKIILHPNHFSFFHGQLTLKSLVFLFLPTHLKQQLPKMMLLLLLPWVHFVKVKCHFWCFKCHFMAFKTLLFWSLNSNFCCFKHQKLYYKIGNWKCRCLALKC